MLAKQEKNQQQPMKIDLLANHRHWLPTLANWYVQEWGQCKDAAETQKEIQNLQAYCNKNKVPLILVAFENDTLLGAVQLKMHEMTIYPNYPYWVGGVYVGKQHRKRGIAKLLVLEAIDKARELHIDKLYLQTENLSGGIYKELGWSPIEEVNYNGEDVVVMQKAIATTIE